MLSLCSGEPWFSLRSAGGIEWIGLLSRARCALCSPAASCAGFSSAERRATSPLGAACFSPDQCAGCPTGGVDQANAL